MTAVDLLFRVCLYVLRDLPSDCVVGVLLNLLLVFLLVAGQTIQLSFENLVPFLRLSQVCRRIEWVEVHPSLIIHIFEQFRDEVVVLLINRNLAITFLGV